MVGGNNSLEACSVEFPLWPHEGEGIRVRCAPSMGEDLRPSFVAQMGEGGLGPVRNG